MHESFNKGIGLSAGFSLASKSPLDTRVVVDTLDERDALVTDNIAYEGMIVYVKDEKKHFKLKDETTNTWGELGSGSTGDMSDYQKIEESTLKTLNKKIPDAINELADMLTVPAEYVEPTLKLSVTPSELKQEVGTKITPILSYVFTQNDAGAELSHVYSPIDNETQAELTIVEGDNIEYSVTVNYDEGIQKQDNFGKDSGTPIASGSVTDSIKYIGVRKMFYGVNSSINTYTTSNDVRGLTKCDLENITINIPVNSKQVVIAIPSTKTLTKCSYVEQGRADYKNNFTKSTIQVSGSTLGQDLIDYDVYVYNFAIPNASAMNFDIEIN